MIIAQINFPAITIHPVRGVEAFTLPYCERIGCSGYSVKPNEEKVYLYGAFLGEATIIFSIHHAEEIFFKDETTEHVMEKWYRVYEADHPVGWNHVHFGKEDKDAHN